MFGAGWCGGMGVVGWVVMALVWGSLLAVVVWAVSRLFPRTDIPRANVSAGGGENATGPQEGRLADDIDEDPYRHAAR